MNGFKHGIIIATLLLTSCTVFSATRIVLWHSYRGQEKNALEKIVNQYNISQQKNRVETLQVPHDAYPDKISAAIPRGKGPDIFIFAQDRIGDWAAKDVIQPIGFWVTDELKEKFFPLTIDALTYNDELYGLPTSFKCTALYYNRELLATPPKNTDELIQLGKKLTDHEAKKFGLVYENGLLYYNSLWIYGFGGGLFDENQNPTIDSSENAEALTFSRNLLRKYKIMPEEISNSLVKSLFNEGKAAMVISGPWFRAEIADDIDYGVHQLPVITHTSKPATPFLTVEAYMMSAQTDHPLEAFEVMKTLTSYDNAIVMAAEGKQPVAVTAAFDHKIVKSDPWINVFKKQLEHSVAMPAFPEMRMIWTPMDIAITKILNKGVEPSIALSEAQAKVEKDIKLYRKLK